MNVYRILTDDVRYVEEYIDGFARYEQGRFYGLVAAPSRGTAKSIFVSAHERHDVEWTTPMSIHLIVKDVDLPECILPDMHPAAVWASFVMNKRNYYLTGREWCVFEHAFNDLALFNPTDADRIEFERGQHDGAIELERAMADDATAIMTGDIPF